MRRQGCQVSGGACCKPAAQVDIGGNISYIPGANQLADVPGVVQMSDVYRISAPCRQLHNIVFLLFSVCFSSSL